MKTDMRATVRELEERNGIPKSSIHRIIQDKLEMTRVVARSFQNFYQMNKSENGRESVAITEIMEKQEIFLDRIVTGDETWFHYHEP